MFKILKTYSIVFCGYVKLVGRQLMTSFYIPDSSFNSGSYEDKNDLEDIRRYVLEDSSSISSSSSSSSGVDEPIPRRENKRWNELERLNIVRRIHRDRKRLIRNLGCSGPSTDSGHGHEIFENYRTCTRTLTTLGN